MATERRLDTHTHTHTWTRAHARQPARPLYFHPSCLTRPRVVCVSVSSAGRPLRRRHHHLQTRRVGRPFIAIKRAGTRNGSKGNGPLEKHVRGKGTGSVNKSKTKNVWNVFVFFPLPPPGTSPPPPRSSDVPGQWSRRSPSRARARTHARTVRT